MKRTKKLLALVLALMMALSCMAMPAMALENGAARTMLYCSICSKYQDMEHIYADIPYKRTQTVGGCSKTNLSHQHTITYRDCVYKCPGGNHTTMPHTHSISEVCHYKG